jgi:hypothetical protein
MPRAAALGTGGAQASARFRGVDDSGALVDPSHEVRKSPGDGARADEDAARRLALSFERGPPRGLMLGPSFIRICLATRVPVRPEHGTTATAAIRGADNGN